MTSNICHLKNAEYHARFIWPRSVQGTVLFKYLRRTFTYEQI